MDNSRAGVVLATAILVVGLVGAGLLLGTDVAVAHEGSGEHNGHCESSKSAKRDGEIRALEVAHPIDRDGDGAISGFRIDVRSDSRQSLPRRKGKEAYEKLWKGLTSRYLGIALPMKDGCVDLVPGYRLTVKTQSGRTRLGAIHPSDPDKYPGVGKVTESSSHYVTRLETDSNGHRYVPGAARVDAGSSGGPLYFVPNYNTWPTETSELVGGDGTARITEIRAETCWRPRGHLSFGGEFKGTSVDRCRSPDDANVGGVLKSVLKSFAGTSTLTRSMDREIEAPGLDRKTTVSVTSDPAGATVYDGSGTPLGTTPFTTEVRVDVAGSYTGAPSSGGAAAAVAAAAGGIERRWDLAVDKPGYEREDVTLTLTDDDPTAAVALDRERERVTVTSEPSDMAVWLDGDQVGHTPWTKRLPTNEKYDVTVGVPLEDSFVLHYNQSFTAVEPGTTLHADLPEKEFTTDTTVSVPPVNTYVNSSTTEAVQAATSYSDVLGGYVTNLSTIGSPSLVSINRSRDMTTVLDPVVANTSALQFLNATMAIAPGGPRIDTAVRFDATASHSLLGSIDGYRWQFGDGTAATGRLADHTYTSTGTYPVTLTVTDTAGETASVTRSLTVRNTPPIAHFGVSAAGPTTVGSSVSFDASTSSDPEGAISTYEWDFGDGSTATGPTVSHTFTEPGNATVTLAVTDSGGKSDTVTRTVRVLRPNRPPTAAMRMEPAAGASAVDFSGRESSDPDGSVRQFVWDFGDGRAANGTAVTHEFNASGTYTVELLVVDDDGHTDALSRTVTVPLTTPVDGTTAPQRTETGDSATPDEATTAADGAPPETSVAEDSPSDADGDGYPDGVEVELGTDPAEPTGPLAYWLARLRSIAAGLLGTLAG